MRDWEIERFSPSFGAFKGLCFVIVEFPRYLNLYFYRHIYPDVTADNPKGDESLINTKVSCYFDHILDVSTNSLNPCPAE